MRSDSIDPISKIEPALKKFVRDLCGSSMCDLDDILLEGYFSELSELLTEFCKSGCADTKFRAEILTGDPQKIYAQLWEAQLHRFLSRLGLSLKSKDHGPDFFFKYRDFRVWVEATTVSSDSIPNPDDSFESGFVPEEPFALRWINSIQRKAIGEINMDKKSDNSFRSYLAGNKSDVRHSDICIIAVSSIRMLKERFFTVFSPTPNGPSYAELVTLGYGGLVIDADGKVKHQRRNTIQKANGSLIDANLFSLDSYRHISGVFAAHTPICTSLVPISMALL